MSNVASLTNVAIDPSVGITASPGFNDRRQSKANDRGLERRQFGNSYRHLSGQARELAEAIDTYKVENRRRYITTDEMLEVIHALGYRQQ